MFKSERMKTARLLERSLDTESLRRRVIANNIANVDVPHFKRSEVNFESELQRAIQERNSVESAAPAIRTHEKHISFSTSRSAMEVKPRIRLDYSSTYRNDGNNVDTEREMVDAGKNVMRYNAFSQLIGGIFNKIKMVMRSNA